MEARWLALPRIGWGLSGMTIKSAARIESLRRKHRFLGSVGVVASCVLALIATTPPIQAQQLIAFNIQSQDLNSAVLAFAQRAGIRIFYDTKKLRGRTAPTVTGSMSPQDALARLLAGSGLTYRFTSARAITIGAPEGAESTGAAPAASIALEAIEVQGASSLQQEGRAQDGYRAKTVSSVGPLGPMALKDAPFSISVAPKELIENIQAQSPDDVFKVIPNVRTTVPQITGWSPMVNIRGFSTYDTAEDGLRRSYSHATNLEDKERIEILSGLSGFLYGAAAPGGMVNYVYKRPTYERYSSVTLGNYGGSQAYVHGDFGGRIDDGGTAGYRINFVKQGGETSIDDQSINRGLISTAFDWQATEKLKLEFNASHSRTKTENPSTYWIFSGVPHSVVPDPSKNWGQKWIRDEFEKTRVSAKATYELSDSVTVRGGYMREYSNRPVQDHIMNLVDTLGEYQQISIHSGRTKSEDEAAQAIADVKFDTGSISHKLSFGYYMNATKAWGTTYSPNSGWLGPFPISVPTYLPMPAFPVDGSSPYYQGDTRNHNLFIGDQITFSEQWSALVGVNYSRIRSTSLDALGMLTQPDYDEGRLSPSVSLIYKVMPWMTLYGSYIEGLEQGGVAPDTATNFGQILAPMVSKQKEVGAKAELGGVLLTAALFDIEKAYEFTNASGVYTQDGRQQHRGVEFTATGKVTSNLTVVGGFTFLDAMVHGGEFDGLAPMNVAKVLAKVYAEYQLPWTSGFFLTGGVYYTGKQWANDVNSDRLAAYTTLDLGIRYTTEQFGNPLTLRLNVANVTNEAYWMNSYYLGKPRTVAFSAQMRF